MSGGSGNDNLLQMGLMIAAGIAAPELAPFLMEGGAAGLGMGATAATATTGAALSGLAGAATGQDPAKAAAMGALGGAASGYFGGVNPAEQGSMLASGPTASNAGLSSIPTPAMYPTAPPIPNMASGQVLGTDALSGAQITGPQVSGLNSAAIPPTTGPSPDVLKTMAQQADAAKYASQPQLFGMPKADVIGGGIAGVNSILSAQPTSAYVPPDAKYKGGSLANFKYDPNRYTPADVPPLPYSYRQMAMGGLAMGGPAPTTNFANPSQSMMGTSQYSMATDPMSGNIAQRNMAGGGLASISNFAGGGVTGSGQMQLNVPINIDDAGNSPYTPAGGGFGGGGGYAPPGGPQGGSVGSLASLGRVGQQSQPPGAAPQAAQGAQAQGAQMNMQDNAQSAQGMSNDVNGFTPIQTNQGTLLAGQFLQGLSGMPQAQNASNAMGNRQYGMPANGGKPAAYGSPAYEPPIGMASGGIASLGMYSDGGRLLRGPGDGVSDNIPARIGQRQEARLADGEFVVPARIVSELGNGSTEAGAKRLYKMMDNVQSARKKSIGKGKFAQNTKAYKHLPV
jgi:hypothetical protein